MGGDDSAPQPVELLLAALLGCTQATAVYVGRNMNPRLIIDRIEFDTVEAYRDERGALASASASSLEQPSDRMDGGFPTVPARLLRVGGTVRVHFKGKRGSMQKEVSVSEEQLRILGEQTEARCPVANMMHASGCEMDLRWMNGSGS
mmetsp:Transcript_32635/g.62395  ORF Transcript_32635/g.62395 Transcript_32635/m.62395 type:complete len:147 (+) Transcript_32635:1-441(+)